MPTPSNLTKAELQEIRWNEDGTIDNQFVGKNVEVQLNPQTLKVSFANQKSGGDQSGGSAIQYVGQGTTSLSFDLWFDVTVLAQEGENPPDDVRKLTQDIVYFITPKLEDQQDDNQYIPPGVRFVWGTFLFEGIADSVNENLEFFSEDGRPLRAGVSIKLSKQEIQFQFGEGSGAGGGPSTPGTQPQEPAREGDSVQQMASRAGRPNDWKSIAAANNIENPRRLSAGILINLKVS